MSLDPSVQPTLDVASDYAVLETGDWHFYYGYEWGYMQPHPDSDDVPEERWGFRATYNGTVRFNVDDETLKMMGVRIDRTEDTAHALLLCLGLAALKGGWQ